MLRKILVFLAIVMVSLPLVAQRQGVKNIPYIDQRRVHYGFLLGVNLSDVTMMHSGANTWTAECPSVNPAFCVGLMGDVALTEHLNVRCTPTLYFMSRDVKFIDQSTLDTRTQTLKNNYLELPISLKVATHRINNYRPYMLMGVQADYDLAHEKEQPIVFRRLDLGLHVAMGCDFYLPFFKFCPELRFNLGLLDMLDHKRTDLKDETMRPYTDALNRARNKSVSLIFFFE
ncbi:MAG: PorT family protein [Bacteroidales bacterium]|nr:PorT family protein [Candidatus Liminaster caballi]